MNEKQLKALELNKKVDYLTKELYKLPHEENGLFNDNTRKTKEFIEIDSELTKTFKELQNTNKNMTKKELRDLRNYKRKLKLNA